MTESPLVVRVEEIERDPSSYVDPHGFLFHQDGKIFRCIRAGAAAQFRTLIEDGSLAQLIEKHGLVPTSPVAMEVADEPNGLVVEHERVWPLSYCVEWCPSMLRDAGHTTINLAIELVDRGLTLQDAYPWNVLYSGSTPVFVDLTSIVPTDQTAIWPAHEQFEAFFLRPLALAAEGKGKVARALLFDNISGIGLEDFYRLVSLKYHIRHPGLTLARSLDRRLQRSPAMKERIRGLSERATAQATPDIRRRFLKGLSRRLDALKTQQSGDPWRAYYSEIGPDVDKSAKLDTIKTLLDRLAPKTVLDLGCNTGVFSLEAARLGARVIAMDSSEACIETLYAAAHADNLAITPIISDVVCPTPQYGFMAQQYPAVFQRAASDLVLCLGLMHHLHITGRQTFERIAALLNSVAQRHLIFEFVARDDGNVPHLPQRRTIDYTLETVVAALRNHFPNIEIMPSDRSTRRLLLCKK